MANYWGMEFVEVIDPKQPEGTRVDATTYALLSGMGYYERLKEQCYFDQFINVFYRAVVVPVMDYLENRDIVPEVVSVAWDDSTLFPDRLNIKIDEYLLAVQITHRELEQKDFPDIVGSRLAFDIERSKEHKAAQYLLNIMTPQQREYLNDVVEARGFDSMDRVLYLSRYFEDFYIRGLIVHNGNYYMPSKQMILMWQLNRER